MDQFAFSLSVSTIPAINPNGMIKTFLLIFNPAEAWDRIVRARRSLLYILVLYLLPLLVLTSLAEAYGLIHWGKLQGTARLPRIFSLNQALLFETGYVALSLLIVFVGAQVVKAMGDTFHGRNTYGQTFTLIAYGLGPVFMMHVLDAFTPVSPWATWGVGILFSWAILYHGVPKVMEPDPPHAFGLYLVTSFVLFLATGLARLVTALYLEGRLADLGPLSRLARHSFLG
jgi:Yip1 domain